MSLRTWCLGLIGRPTTTHSRPIDSHALGSAESQIPNPESRRDSSDHPPLTTHHSRGLASTESRISNPESRLLSSAHHSRAWRGTAIVIVAAVVGCGAALAADNLGTGLRGNAPLDQEPKAPRLPTVENFDVRRGRAYTSQPPTIPHQIDRYEVTKNVNFCMYCHSRVRNEEFGAPMVSATHYMDRDHDYLAEISPRRYFCTACHVVQTDAREPVDNRFVDVYELIEREQRSNETQNRSRSESSAEARERRQIEEQAE